MSRDKILIVDDMEINRAILRELLMQDYEIIEAEDGSQALELLHKFQDSIAIMLLDIVMPQMDGFKVLEKLQDSDIMHVIPIVLITGNNSNDTEKKGYDLGVSDIISKPFDPYIVIRRVKNVIDLYMHKNNLEEMVAVQTKKLEEQAEKLRQTSNFVINTLSTVVEFRNLESGKHILRIRGFSKVLLEYVAKYYKEYHLTPEKIEVISFASAMHDVGKIAIPDTILLKPGRLTSDEFEIMKTHTLKGCEILDSVEFIQDEEYSQYCYDICRHHHERYDGYGYPDGLKGEDISIAAQVVSVADVYDALISERIYKPAYTKEEAFQMILDGKCGAFSPNLMKCFKKARHDMEEVAYSE